MPSREFCCLSTENLFSFHNQEGEGLERDMSGHVHLGAVLFQG